MKSNTLKLGLLATTALAAVMLVGCGDDGGSNSNGPSNSDQVVASFDDLSVCTPKREGMTAYVKDERTGYVCKDGDWVPDNGQGPSSETSSAATGSSENGNSQPDGSSGAGVSQSGDSSDEGNSRTETSSESGNSEEVSSSSSSSSKTVAENRCRNGSFIDARDGKTYGCVTIGTLTWMSRNLDYDYKVDGQSYGSQCHENDTNCAKYGRFYSWAAAMDTAKTGCGNGKSCENAEGVRGVCPAGWHLPSLQEWGALLGTVGGTDLSKLGCSSTTDDYGFAVISMRSWECDASFWSSSQGYYIKGLTYGQGVVTSTSANAVLSVRCVENHGLEWQPPFVDVRDGQQYKTVIIDGKTWMAENLNYEYKVGDSTYGSWCYENSADSCAKYGRLYSWAAAMDSATTRCGDGDTCRISGNVRGICPAGWHLPSETELGTLANISSNMLKSSKEWNGNDFYGFAALPSGSRCPIEDPETNQLSCQNREFVDAGQGTIFWSSTDSETQASALIIMWSFPEIEGHLLRKSVGLSVRCAKD